MTRSTRSLLLRLEVESPLSVGSGRERGVFKEVLKVPVKTSRGVEDLPVIPATSLKGAFRGIAEMLGRSWGEESGEDEPRIKLMALHRRSGGEVKHGNGEEVKELLEKLMSGLSEKEKSMLEEVFSDDEEKLAYFCPICRLFGAPGMAAGIKFSDALPKKLTMQQMTRTAIDREGLKAAEEKLFVDEVIAPGSKFSLVMLIDVSEGSLEDRLLGMVMEFAKEVGLQLGGGKSVGRGCIKIVKSLEGL